MAGEHERHTDDLYDFDPPSSVQPIAGVDSVELLPPPSEVSPDTEPATTKKYFPDTQIAPTVATGTPWSESLAESGEHPITQPEPPSVVMPVSAPASRPTSRDLPPYAQSILEPSEEDDAASQRKQQEAA
jgi:hypothetical protein